MTDLEKAAQQEPIGYTDGINWQPRQSEMVVKIVRNKQPEHGFVHAIYTSPQPAQQEPVAWVPIEQMYPQAKAIDILMGDGSILCAVLPQFDGDLWWEGSGTGEKFIDPKYANVTHWRIHDERTSPQSKPWVGLTREEKQHIIDANFGGSRADCMDEAERILRRKNT